MSAISIDNAYNTSNSELTLGGWHSLCNTIRALALASPATPIYDPLVEGLPCP